MRERGARFILAAHFFENVREQDVLTWLIWLPGDRASLNSASIFETVLLHPHGCDEAERLRVVYVEPARMSQRVASKIDIAFLRIQATQSEHRAIMPPIRVNKFFDQWQSGVGSFALAQHF